jgi:hypothetical protein
VLTIGKDGPTTGEMKGVRTLRVKLILTVTESEPGSVGPFPLDVALVMAAPFKQWKVTLKVAPEIEEPAGDPVLELSRAAELAMVAMGPPLGGIGEVTVVATGPPAVLEHAVLAVLC